MMFSENCSLFIYFFSVWLRYNKKRIGNRHHSQTNCISLKIRKFRAIVISCGTRESIPFRDVYIKCVIFSIEKSDRGTRKRGRSIRRNFINYAGNWIIKSTQFTIAVFTIAFIEIDSFRKCVRSNRVLAFDKSETMMTYYECYAGR